MKPNKSLLSIGALVALMAFAGFGGTASAAAPRQTPGKSAAPNTNPHPARIIGRVASVTGSGITLTAPRGTVTANASDSTWILVERDGRCAEGTLNDLRTGAPAAVAGMTTGDPNVINARVIAQARCRGFEGKIPKPREDRTHLAMGTIKAISGSALTVTTAKGGDVTVNTTADTVVFNNGFQSVSSLKVGDKIEMLMHPDKPAKSTPGAKDAPRTVTAWALRVDNAATRLVMGHVQSVNGNTLTLRTPAQKDGLTVTLGSGTAYKALTVSDGKFALGSSTQATIKVGSNLVVEGPSSADGKNITAKAVVVLPEGKQPQKP